MVLPWCCRGAAVVLPWCCRGVAVVLSAFMPLWLSGAVGGRLREIGEKGRFGRRIPAKVYSLLVDGIRWRYAGTDAGGFNGGYSAPLTDGGRSYYAGVKAGFRMADGCFRFLGGGRRLLRNAAIYPAGIWSLFFVGLILRRGKGALPWQALFPFLRVACASVCGGESCWGADIWLLFTGLILRRGRGRCRFPGKVVYF